MTESRAPADVPPGVPEPTAADHEVLFEQLLAEALRSPEPLAAVQRMAADPRLAADQRAVLARVHPQGLAMSALLVAKLRFERLIQGSRLAGDFYATDAAGFVEAFRRYHTEVAPRVWQPADEGRAFESWLDAPPQGRGVPDGQRG